MKRTASVVVIVFACAALCACDPKPAEERPPKINVQDIAIDLDSFDASAVAGSDEEAAALEKAVSMTKEMEDALAAEYSAVEEAIAEAEADLDSTSEVASPEDGVAGLGETETGISVGDNDGVAEWMSSLYVDGDSIKGEAKTIGGKRAYAVHYSVSPGDPIVFLHILRDAGLKHYVEIEAIVDTNTTPLDEAIKIASVKQP